MQGLTDRPRDRLFFLHVPKTAGTSLRQFLRGQYAPEHILPAEDWQGLARLPPGDLGRYRLFQGHFSPNLETALPPGTATALLLREPAARLLSVLRHMRRDPQFHPLHHRVHGRTIPEILRMPDVMELQRDVQTAILCAAVPAAEVVAALGRAAVLRQPLEAWQLERPATPQLALDRLAGFAHVGLTEEFGPFVERLSAAMGFHPPTLLPALNVAGGPDGIDSLDAADVALLRDFNRHDIALYETARTMIEHRRCEAAVAALVDRGLYRVVHAPFEIDLAGPVHGSGWHDAEHDGGSCWRWTGPHRRFTLELPLARGDRISGCLRFRPRPGWRPQGFAVLVGTRPAPVSLSEQDGAWTARFPVQRPGADAAADFCRIVFDAGEAPSPASAHDLRPLGIAVDRIAFERD